MAITSDGPKTAVAMLLASLRATLGEAGLLVQKSDMKPFLED